MEAKEKLGSIVIEEDEFKGLSIVDLLNEFELDNDPIVQERDSVSEILNAILS